MSMRLPALTSSLNGKTDAPRFAGRRVELAYFFLVVPIVDVPVVLDVLVAVVPEVVVAVVAVVIVPDVSVIVPDGIADVLVIEPVVSVVVIEPVVSVVETVELIAVSVVAVSVFTFSSFLQPNANSVTATSAISVIITDFFISSPLLKFESFQKGQRENCKFGDRLPGSLLSPLFREWNQKVTLRRSA